MLRDRGGKLWQQVSRVIIHPCHDKETHEYGNADIDDKNLQYALKNVSQNGLESRIRVIKTEPSDPLIPLGTVIPLDRYGGKACNIGRSDSAKQRHSLDFTMCNPPFYESKEEMVTSAQAKSRPPFSVRTAF